jgi:hypothetical protein
MCVVLTRDVYIYIYMYVLLVQSVTFVLFHKDLPDIFLYVYGSVHRESWSVIVQQDATIYSLLYLYILLALHVSAGNSAHHQEHSSNCSTIAEGSRDGLTSATCSNYSYMCSWWWAELPTETCSASSIQRYNKLYIVASCWTITDIAFLTIPSQNMAWTIKVIFVPNWYNFDLLICWRSLILTLEAQIFHSNVLTKTVAANLHFFPRQGKLFQSRENVVFPYLWNVAFWKALLKVPPGEILCVLFGGMNEFIWGSPCTESA